MQNSYEAVVPGSGTYRSTKLKIVLGLNDIYLHWQKIRK